MKRSGKSIIYILVIVFLFSVISISAMAGEKTWGTVSRYDIVTTAQRAGDFTILVTALKAAGLEGLMREQNSYTVFAPTDEAFSKLPEGTVENLLLPENVDQLKAILTYHVIINRRIISPMLRGVHGLKTVNGKILNVSYSPAKVRINNAFVIQPDITTRNGMIHVIDTVLIP